MTAVSVALSLLATLILVPCSVLAVQVLAGLWRPKRSEDDVVAGSVVDSFLPDVCLLMPAHNEAAGIANVLQGVLPQLGPRSRLLVVADNCTDNTAAIVRTFAETCPFISVIERQNAQLRGKGYALDHGVRHLEQQPPEIVLVMDADCVLGPNAAATLARRCVATNRPVQALYLMLSPPAAGVKGRFAEFAWLVKNHVRALGFHQLGLPCQLTGTGMAFTWRQISQAQLSTGHIVEDMQLGVDLALAGTPPLFCPDALVTSFFPANAEGLATQRTRWEHGHLGVIVSQVPQLLWQGIRHCNGALLAMALDLCVPPLALLTLLTGGAVVSGFVWVWVGGGSLAACLSLAGSTLLGLAVAGAWYGFGRGVIDFWQLCQVPLYVIRKIPLYLQFLVRRQSSWVRSRRDGES